VTGIGYLPQVATCGYENQDLRAARCTKPYCTKKTTFWKRKFDAVNTPNAIEVYDKIPHFNSPQGININRHKAIDTTQLRQELHGMTGS
jgi:hypothetical protein